MPSSNGAKGPSQTSCSSSVHTGGSSASIPVDFASLIEVVESSATATGRMAEAGEEEEDFSSLIELVESSEQGALLK